MKPLGRVIVCGIVALLLTSCQTDSEDNRPNILLIVADDLGYTDLGIFGSEIPTPNLDLLASQGMILTNFYAAPTCSPTRAMLFSGTDNHLAGLGTMAEVVLPNRVGQPGFESYLNNDVASLGDLMTEAGYNTYMAGKWHLGMTEETSPAARGMKRSFALLDGGAAHLGSLSLGTPQYQDYYENGELAPYRNGYELVRASEDFYSTRDYTHHIMDFIEADQADGKPFFAYLAYTAPHWPLQAPDDSIARFKGKYDEGYEALHQQRLSRMAEVGLLPDGATVNTAMAFSPPWETLTDEERQKEARSMEIYAAMVSDMDIYVGELIDYLKSIDEFDNTLIFFMSDNGAEAGSLNSPFTVATLAPWIERCCDNSLDNMGKGDSYVYHGPNWATAVGGPFRSNKGTTFEGGIHVPAFVYFPQAIMPGQVNGSIASVTDLLPTFLALAGTQPPGSNYDGREINPPTGKSLLPVFSNASEAIHNDEYLARELFGWSSLRKGDWKIVMFPQAGVEPAWELYNLAEDLSESINLASSNPEKADELLKLWASYAADVGLTQ